MRETSTTRLVESPVVERFRPCVTAIGIALVLFVGAQSTSAAELRFARLFGDRMVLPAERPIRVWGEAPAGIEVEVSLGDQMAQSTADAKGHWSVELPALPCSFEPRKLRAHAGDEAIELSDIVVGEVWVAGGQSNMQWTLGQCLAEESSLSAHTQLEEEVDLRWCRIDEAPAREPRTDLSAPINWRRVDDQSAGAMSAAAFFFARRLAMERRVPIGIVDTSRGGTPIEPFIPRSEFTGHPTLEAELKLGDADDLLGLKELPGGVFARDEAWLPGRLYHSRIEPLRGLRPMGVIWYQGESNSGQGEDPTDYRFKQAALVAGWRDAFADPELPFHFVQLPRSGAGANWPRLREEQRLAETPPRAGMVVTIDLEGGGIHPWNKFDVGERLARWALLEEPYDDESVRRCRGPRPHRIVREDDRLVIEFDSSGPIWLGRKDRFDRPSQLDEAEVPGWEIQRGDGTWETIAARLHDGGIVIAVTPEQRTAAVRYAWAPQPPLECLYDDSELPLPPWSSENLETR